MMASGITDSSQAKGNRKWSDQDLLAAIDDINSGKAYQDVCHEKHIPIGTLWSRVKGKFQGQVRPKTGAPTMFSEEFEEDIALFVKHMELLRVPVVKEKLKEDIVHYITMHRMNCPRMPDDGPGRSWFDRFGKIWNEMVNFKSKGEVFRIRNYPITMRKWVFERDNYTRIQKFTKSFCNRTYIFVAEVESLELTRGNNFQVNCVMIYNADGEILRPIIVHGGNVSGYCQVNYGDMFTFVKSKDGQIDREVVWSVWHAVRSILKARGMTDIPVIYFVPKLSRFISLYLWDQCNLENVIMQTIPYNIYNYFRTGNMGIFEKVMEAFQRVSDRMVPQSNNVLTSIQFCDVLREMVKGLRIAGHLRNSCRRLRIVAVRRCAVQDEIIYDVQEEPETDVGNVQADQVQAT